MSFSRMLVVSPSKESAWRLDKREEAFLEDVEDGSEEECQSQEDEQLVRQLPAVVLEDQLPTEVDGSRHVFKLLVGFLHCSGGGRCALCVRERGRGREVLLCFYSKTTPHTNEPTN